MTEKERGDFDALVLWASASSTGQPLDSEIEIWVRERLRERSADAMIRVAGRLRNTRP